MPPDVTKQNKIVLHHNLTAFYIQLLVQLNIPLDQKEEKREHREHNLCNLRESIKRLNCVFAGEAL
jgi:hypothetical protein